MNPLQPSRPGSGRRLGVAGAALAATIVMLMIQLPASANTASTEHVTFNLTCDVPHQQALETVSVTGGSTGSTFTVTDNGAVADSKHAVPGSFHVIYGTLDPATDALVVYDDTDAANPIEIGSRTVTIPQDCTPATSSSPPVSTTPATSASRPASPPVRSPSTTGFSTFHPTTGPPDRPRITTITDARTSLPTVVPAGSSTVARSDGRTLLLDVLLAGGLVALLLAGLSLGQNRRSRDAADE